MTTEQTPATGSVENTQATPQQESTTLGGDGKTEAAADGKTSEQQASTEAGAAKEGEAKTEGDKTEDDKSEGNEGKKDEKPGAPEKYELKYEEGVQADAELTPEFEKLAKELNLSNTDAQKVADIGSKLAQRLASKPMEVLKQADAEWQQASKADSEFGGEAFDANMAVAKKAIDTFGTPELKKLFDDSRLGNNPEVIRFAYRVGKAISEDAFVNSDAGARAADSKSVADRLYNKTGKKE